MFSNVFISSSKNSINVMFKMYYLMCVCILLLFGCDDYGVVYVLVMTCRIRKWWRIQNEWNNYLFCIQIFLFLVKEGFLIRSSFHVWIFYSIRMNGLWLTSCVFYFSLFLEYLSIIFSGLIFMFIVYQSNIFLWDCNPNLVSLIHTFLKTHT